MSRVPVQRRLAAILAADVVGYSRLVRDDEETTVSAVGADIAEVFAHLIKEHNGRMFKKMGDGLLAEFQSVVEALRCAVDAQRAMETRNQARSVDRRIVFRIGINLGDVVADGADLQGDGVNIAARLESLAEPGGIWISNSAYEQVRDKLDVDFQDKGERTLKNIDRPVRAYQVIADQDVQAERRTTANSLNWRLTALLGLSLLATLAVTLMVWQPWTQKADRASTKRMAFPLPDKPSIAVLPFANVSGSAAQDYVADGLTETVISALARVPELLVIARNSSFYYKDRAVKVQEAAEELGVRYILEGSVQRSQDQLRVTAQLVDAIHGRLLWSERYDRDFSDLFAVQDDLTRRIVVGMQVQLTEGDQARVRAHSTNNLQAWGLAMRGAAALAQVSREDTLRGREYLLQAINLDPNYAWARSMIARSHWNDARFGFSKDRRQSLQEALVAAKKAVSINASDPEAHAYLAGVLLFMRRYDEALASANAAFQLGPNLAEVNRIAALVFRSVGEWDSCIERGDFAMRLHPRFPSYYLIEPGLCRYFKRDFTGAIERFQAGLNRSENKFLRSSFLMMLAASHSDAGNLEKAKLNMRKSLELNPRLTARLFSKITAYKNAEHLKRALTALRAAGLPE